MVDIIQDNCARQVNHFISEFAEENSKLPPIGIVVTKFDIAARAIDKNNPNEASEFLDKVIRKAFNALIPDPTVFNGKGLDSFVGIFPVSLGAHIGDNENGGKMRPSNMQYPAYMGIWFLLHDLCKKDKNKAEEYSLAMKKLANEIENEGMHFFNNGQCGRFSELADDFANKTME